MITYYEMKFNARSPLIDDAILNEIRDFMGEEGDDTVRDLIQIYIKNTPKAIAQIADDLQNMDLEALKMHVHGLKGSSSGVGAVGISDTCKAIEVSIRENQTDSINGLFENLTRMYRQVEIDFRQRL